MGLTGPSCRPTWRQQARVDAPPGGNRPELMHTGCIKRGVTLRLWASREDTFRARSVYQNQHQESTHTMCIRGVRQDDSVHQGAHHGGASRRFWAHQGGASRRVWCIKRARQDGCAALRVIKRVHQDGWVHQEGASTRWGASGGCVNSSGCIRGCIMKVRRASGGWSASEGPYQIVLVVGIKLP